MEKWQDSVQKRLKRGNAVLFQQKDSLFLDLETLLEEASHKAIVLWALELCEETEKRIIEIDPEEQRGRICIEESALWAAGFIKMPIAKRAIIDCHAIAKVTDDKELIALSHAIAQGCSCAHTPKHALGYPIYDLTALVRREGFDSTVIENRVAFYLESLRKAMRNENVYEGPWAAFFEKPDGKR